MPYLSRIYLNPLRTGTQRLLRNPQAVHAAVLGGIARQPVTERVLWRLETRTPHRAELLVLTDSTPSWEHLIEQAGWLHADGPQALVRTYQPLLNQLHRGREFAFRLRANPTTATRHPDKPSPAQQQRLAGGPRARGVRVAHRTAQYQLDWLRKSIPRWGFELPVASCGADDVLLTGRSQVSFSKTGDGDRRHRVTLTTATFDGRLRVTEPAAAARSLLQGVGTARAYGCGLITLAPLHTTQG